MGIHISENIILPESSESTKNKIQQELKWIVRFDGELRCPECKFECAQIKELKKHLTTHYKKWSNDQLKQYLVLLENAIQEKRKGIKFRIFSKRGTKIYEKAFCDICQKPFSIGWIYSETTKGEVCICNQCKDKYKTTHIPYRTIIKTSFESSRSKH